MRITRSFPPIRAALLVAVLSVAGGAAALAYVQTNLVDLGFSDIGVFQLGGNLVLRLEQDASFRITDGSDITTLQASMQRWTDVPTSNATITEGARFNLASPIDAGAGLGNDGINRVYFAETDTSNHLSSAIAVSFFYVAGDGRITDCDIVFNERLYTFSTTTPANPNQNLGPTTYDLGELSTHEMGHCLGFDHSAVAGRFASTGLEVSGFTSGDFSSQATLYPYGSRTIQGRSLSQDDMSGVSFIYPNSTLASTMGTISGRVLDGGTFSPIKGAHVVAVAASAPDVPVVGVISDVQGGGPGGGYTIVGLPPGSYSLRLEPLVGTSNPFTQSNTHFTGFNTSFPPEFYDGATESGFDLATDRVAIDVAAGQTVTGIDFLTNVAAPDPNEPNNTRASATPVTCEQTVHASIVPQGDIDYYALSITNATALQVDINAARSGSPLDPIVGVFDAAGNRLGFADNTVSFDPILNVDLLSPGTYYIAAASFNDSTFTGSDARTVGDYSMTVRCSIPEVRTGTCGGRVLYASSNGDGAIYAISDSDHDLRFDGQSVFASGAGSGLGAIVTRRDGGVCLGNQSQTVFALYDDTGDFTFDRTVVVPTSVGDTRALGGARRAGAEYLFTGDLFSAAPLFEMLDSGGDALPERTTPFAPAPQSVLGVSADEAGTLYVFDVSFNGIGGLIAYRDSDNDGVADTSTVFLADASPYVNIIAHRAGEVFAGNISLGEIDRIVDRDGDGVADSVTTYAPGLSLDAFSGLAFDDQDVLYVVDSASRVLALPDDDGDGVADRRVQFSPLISGLTGIAFGQGPPGTVSLPGSFHPVGVTGSGSGLRLTWEDQGATVPAYNIYEGTLGSWYSHVPLLCHVTGASDGAGNRFLDITPTGTTSHYYLVTASDRCGEGSAGRGKNGQRRPMPNGACGGVP
ncbi:MAG TPA: hypothetical protein VEW47_09590 [Candidatus Dormibacteraeota bacterium]|nr:hypothetical protein [Candidatus Dormibacteraeota bacterium]